jgi:peptidyl-prolyl cis-trans isomerase C
MSDEPAVRWTIGRVLREPLAQFALLAVLMIAFQLRSDAEEKRIVVDDELVAAIVTRHEQQYGLPPTAAELQVLVDRYVTEELLYREGRALRLDDEDEVVRRRIVQKMRFLHEDVDATAEPTGAELEAFYRANPERYTLPRKVSFTHAFFSSDIEDSPRARLRAEQALATSGQVSGDAFDGARDYAAMGERDAARVFGHSELSRKLLEAPLRKWSGPYESAFGWHLVLVHARQTEKLRPISEVIEQVRSDLQDRLAESRNAAALTELRGRYTVVVTSALVGNAR